MFEDWDKIERDGGDTEILAYDVNTLVDIDPEVVRAHKEKNDDAKKAFLAEGGWKDLDAHICVNKHSLAFVLCVPVSASDDYPDIFKDDPLFVLEHMLCWRFELCIENEYLR